MLRRHQNVLRSFVSCCHPAHMATINEMVGMQMWLRRALAALADQEAT